jgi:hypothetical protein
MKSISACRPQRGPLAVSLAAYRNYQPRVNMGAYGPDRARVVAGPRISRRVATIRAA